MFCQNLGRGPSCPPRGRLGLTYGPPQALPMPGCCLGHHLPWFPPEHPKVGMLVLESSLLGELIRIRARPAWRPGCAVCEQFRTDTLLFLANCSPALGPLQPFLYRVAFPVQFRVSFRALGNLESSPGPHFSGGGGEAGESLYKALSRERAEVTRFGPVTTAILPSYEKSMFNNAS